MLSARICEEVKFLRYFERDPRDPQTESGQLAPEDVDPNNLRPERYKLILNHNQQLDERSRLIVSGLVYSDSSFSESMREFVTLNQIMRKVSLDH